MFCIILGFSRRYGEYRTNVLNLVIHLKPTTTTSLPTSSSSSSTFATGDPTASALTPNSNSKGNNNDLSNPKPIQNATTVNPLLEIQEYERQFFLLRVLGKILKMGHP